MAAPITKEKSKDHRRRKNPGSAELHAKQKATTNTARGKQVWVWDDEPRKLGHWERVLPPGGMFCENSVLAE